MKKDPEKLPDEQLGSVKMRPNDQGTINGLFEVTFLGAGKKLSAGINITHEMWTKWYAESACLTRKQKLGKEDTSKELDASFERAFRTKLPKGKHVTPGLCENWNGVHRDFLLDILERRKGTPPKGCHR